ncbi:MAG TPA: hypothetical protein VH413_03430 [Verrucomicrobiae bacterium]|jgi:hypothetical protein|nr:hypothetical protein [Verrucomicrobiae bacterium]
MLLAVAQSAGLTPFKFLFIRAFSTGMDMHTEILRWERAIEENPAIAVLMVIVLITVVFIAAVLIDGHLKNRAKKQRRRGGRR